VILLNHVIQVSVGPDERLSGQDALGLQFGDGLVGRPAAVKRNLLVSDIPSHGLNDHEMIEMAAFEEFRLLVNAYPIGVSLPWHCNSDSIIFSRIVTRLGSPGLNL
jgi:hypothetical protein